MCGRITQKSPPNQLGLSVEFQCRVEREAFCPTQEIQSLKKQLQQDSPFLLESPEVREQVNGLQNRIKDLETCTCKDDVADNWTRCQGSPPACFVLIAKRGWLKFDIQLWDSSSSDTYSLDPGERTYITLVDVTPSLSEGFGYGLMLDGAAGRDPETEADTQKVAADPKLRATDSMLQAAAGWLK
jgi:hypothetical protein